MTIYRKYAPAEIEAMASNLKQQLSDGILPAGVLEMFKFRGTGGKTWTVLPQTGAWYCCESGGWQLAAAPDTPLDGSIELLDAVILPLSPLEISMLEADQPAQPDADIRQMLELATRRVRDSYYHGRINSAGAEILLKDLYLLDPAGRIWSFGLHTGEWYFFREGDWEHASEGGPNPLNFQAAQSDSPKYCSSCGIPLNGGKFCSECGSPASQPEGPYSQAAQEVVTRFTESGVAPLPEPVVPDWKPAHGYPVITTPVQSTSKETQWKLQVLEGAGVGQSFTLGAQTRLGRLNTNEIVLADQQSSRLHAVIQQREDGYVIADQNSTNGTFINGMRIQSPARLQAGDTIRIGDTVYIFEARAIAPATLVNQYPPQVQHSTETTRPAPSVSAPNKSRRMFVLVPIIFFLMACLCLCFIGVGGYFYYENQSLSRNYDNQITVDETFAQSTAQASVDNAPLLASPTPTVLAAEISAPPGHTMVLVPAGAFQMGVDADTTLEECLKLHDPEGCDRRRLERTEPIHSVTLGDYYMDKFEVTNAQYAVFLNQQGNQKEAGAAWLDVEHQDTLLVERNDTWQPKDGFANHPVVRVNWYGARAYCQWRGARLPTETEWEKAARGTDGRLYPWGNLFDGRRLNSCDANCSMDWRVVDFDDGYVQTAPIGSYPDGVSPYGLYDMAGNVWEWTADWFDVYPGGNPDSSDYFGGDYRVARGGAFDATGAIGTTYRGLGEPDKPSLPTGFRCVSSP